MSDDQRGEVYRALREVQNRTTYFLLATAAAAIAWAVNLTSESALATSHIPLACAALAWGLSFYCGCSHLRWVSSTLLVNADLLQVQAGLHPRSGTDPTKIAASEEILRELGAENSKQAARYGAWQFRRLVGGAVIFVVWHIWSMALR